MHECFDGAHASCNAVAQIDLQRQLQVRDHAFQVGAIQRGTVHPRANTRTRYCRRPDNARQTCCFHNLIEERTWEFAGHLEAATMARARRHSTILWNRNSNDTCDAGLIGRLEATQGTGRAHHWDQTHWMNPCPARLKQKARDATTAWAPANSEPLQSKVFASVCENAGLQRGLGPPNETSSVPPE